MAPSLDEKRPRTREARIAMSFRETRGPLWWARSGPTAGSVRVQKLVRAPVYLKQLQESM
ncbi:MAG: hypothetical protein QOJ79_2884 [Actinomycetota bacterium]|jgi:hypothetical protein|nr:hypothetical protein [Actinomycetota bacterium]